MNRESIDMRGLLFVLLSVILLGLSACADMPVNSSAEPASGEFGSVPAEDGELETESGSAEAVRELVTSSRTSSASGDYARAAADIERAIRIEPRNPYLWIELGKLHLSRNDPRQAATFARKAMSVAGSDAEARAAAQRLLDRAARY